MMQYKGFTGIMEIDEEAGIIFGKVVGLRDVVTFQGESVAEARKAFQESVDSYLEFCVARGEKPEKPYSGNFVVRIDPEIHRALATKAEAEHISLNGLVVRLLSRPFEAEGRHAPPEIEATTVPVPLDELPDLGLSTPGKRTRKKRIS
jgi:predicted HicB family RNase H-like nuclease